MASHKWHWPFTQCWKDPACPNVDGQQICSLFAGFLVGFAFSVGAKCTCVGRLFSKCTWCLEDGT